MSETGLTYRISLLLLTGVLMLAASCSSPRLGSDDEQLLKNYDAALAARNRATSSIEARIDSLQSQLSALTSRADSVSCLNSMGESWSELSLDSAMNCLDEAARFAAAAGLDSALMVSNIEKSSLLMRQGQDAEALLMFNAISTDTLPAALRERYHYVGMQIGLNLADRSMGHFSSGFFKERTLMHARELLKIVPDTSAVYDYATAACFTLQGKDSKQVSPLLGVTVSRNAPAGVRADALFRLAVYYLRGEGTQSAKAGQYLIKAATEELRMGRKSGLALVLLGQWFYNNGDRHRGFEAWRVALDNKRDSSVANQWASYHQLAAIALRESDRNRRRSLAVIAIMVSLVLLAGALAVIAWRARRRQKSDLVSMERRLGELTGSKESFVSQFLEMVSLYMEGIETQNSLICRKIAAGRTEELVRSIRAGKFAADQGKLLLSGFDKAFLNMYPTFVEDVNALLEPGRQFEPQEPGALSTEMRIMAMARLGIDDGTRVAHFLGVSVNTVYAYRNKVRSRAIDREGFDEKFMKIGTTIGKSLKSEAQS